MTTADDEHTELEMLPMPSEVEPAWYGVYIREPRTRMTATQRHVILLIAVLIAAGLFVFLAGGGVGVTAAILGGVGATFGALTYASTGGKRVGISIGPDTVTFGREGEMHHWRRSALKSVTINNTYTGETLPASIGSYLVHGYRYLTLTRVDGVVAHVSVDSANPYADIIEDVLVHGKPLPELSHPPAPSQQFKKTSTWEREGVTPGMRPKPANPPTAPTISARPDAGGDEYARHAGKDSAPPASAAPGQFSGQAIPEPEEILWRKAVERHDAVLLAYSKYEVDPHLVMQFPAVTDVTVPPTAAFIEALSDAAAFRTEEFSSAKLSQAYRESVSTLEVAWSAAERHARSVGTSLLADADRKRLDQAFKLLRHAESATTDAERATYFGQVKTLMDELARSGAIVTPPKVRQAISTKARLAIAAAEGN